MAAEPSPDPALVAELVAAARSARTRAYAPYSGFRVGAAALAGGAVHSGCNVENVSYGASMCAERVAVFGAVAGGRSRIEALAIVGGSQEPAFPCGICRQVLHELGPDMWVAVATASGMPRLLWLRDLLPHPFGPEDLA